MKTKKQMKPIGRVMHMPEYLGKGRWKTEKCLGIPMTRNGQCQRARVVEAMAKAMWGEDQNHPWGSLGAAVVHSAIKRDASTALTRLGWPETKGGN